MLKKLDINCDLGEGLSNDEALMPYLDSCNIACGGHAGNQKSIVQTIRSANNYQVKIGAHPSFPDKLNFGRKILEMKEEDLKDTLKVQLEQFFEVAEKENTKVNHIKPHGALYNLAAKDQVTASLILELVKDHFSGTMIYCPPNSTIEKLSNIYKIPVFREVFADRTYQDDGSLTNRGQSNAVLTSPEAVLHHLNWIIEKNCIKTVSGKTIPIEAETLCVHGDNPSALSILQAIKKSFN